MTNHNTTKKIFSSLEGLLSYETLNGLTNSTYNYINSLLRVVKPHIPSNKNLSQIGGKVKTRRKSKSKKTKRVKKNKKKYLKGGSLAYNLNNSGEVNNIKMANPSWIKATLTTPLANPQTIGE
jgi:hypothetical protein